MRPLLLAGAVAVSAGPALLASEALAADHLPIEITAQKDAKWEVLCKIQSYKDPKTGGVFNRYGLHTAGSYRDVINSPNADCTLTKTSGSGPVTMRIVRIGKKPFIATVSNVGEKAQLSVF